MDSNTPEKDKEFKETDPLRNEERAEKQQEVRGAVRSYGDTCRHVFKNITMEPAMILFVSSSVISMMTTQNLSLEKACRVNLNFTDEVCDSLKAQDTDSQNDNEREAQKLLASAMATRTLITATVPCLLSFFIGAWSDKTGHRKVFLTIGICGQLLICINNMINAYFFMQLPLEVLVYSEAFLEGFSGGWCIFFLTAFSYVSAITTDKTRTFRLGLINFSLTVGFPIGMGLSGVTLKNFGYYGCYGMAACLHLLNLSYSIFILKEPQRSKEQKKHDGQGFCYFLRTFFDPAHIKNTMKVVFKKTADNRRVRLCILLGTVCVLFGPMYGEVAILYMSTRYRFNWNEVQFSIFQAYNFVTHTTGTMFSILLFSKKLQWHDSLLGIISTFSKLASSFVYCFAPNDKIFYIAPLVDILNGTALLAIRSIFSKSVAPDELGKVNSIVGLAENLMPLMYVPLYTNMYTATMEVLPGAVFLMGSAMTLPAVFVFLWLFIRHRRSLKTVKNENGTESQAT